MIGFHPGIVRAPMAATFKGRDRGFAAAAQPLRIDSNAIEPGSLKLSENLTLIRVKCG
jgi:hypothetical protein